MLWLPLTFTRWNQKITSRLGSAFLLPCTSIIFLEWQICFFYPVSMAAAAHKKHHFVHLPGLLAASEVPNVNQWEHLKKQINLVYGHHLLSIMLLSGSPEYGGPAGLLQFLWENSIVSIITLLPLLLLLLQSFWRWSSMELRGEGIGGCGIIFLFHFHWDKWAVLCCTLCFWFLSAQLHAAIEIKVWAFNTFNVVQANSL